MPARHSRISATPAEAERPRVLRDELLGIGQRAALLKTACRTGESRPHARNRAPGRNRTAAWLASNDWPGGRLDGARRALAWRRAAAARRQATNCGRPAQDKRRGWRAGSRVRAMPCGGDDARRQDEPTATRRAPAAHRGTNACGAVSAPSHRQRRAHQRRRKRTGAMQSRPAARAAIERRDGAALAIAATRIDGGLQRLLAGSSLLAQKRRTATDLRAFPLRVDSPLAGTTLQQLRALRGE